MHYTNMLQNTIHCLRHIRYNNVLWIASNPISRRSVATNTDRDFNFKRLVTVIVMRVRANWA